MGKEYMIGEVLQGLEAHVMPLDSERCKVCPMSAANGGWCITALCKNAARIIKALKDNYANMRDNFESLQKEHARQTEEYNRKLTAARDRIRNLTHVNAELTAKCERLEGLKQIKPTVSGQIYNAINMFVAENHGEIRPSRIIVNRSCIKALEAEIKPFVRDWEAVKTVARFEGIPVEVTESDRNEKPRFSLSYDYRTFDVE